MQGNNQNTPNNQNEKSQNQKKEILYLVGLPCSGKSTYINKKGTYKDYAVISNDLIIEEFAAKNGMTYSQAWGKLPFQTVKKSCEKRFEIAVRKGQSILIDNTNLTVKSRALFQADGYERNAAVFEVDEQERQRREQERAERTGKFVPQDAIEKMKAFYKKPTFSEGFKNITTISFTLEDRLIETKQTAPNTPFLSKGNQR